MDPTARAAVHAQVDAQLETDVARIQRWVRQPSVSWHDHGVEDMARLVAEELEDLGCGGVEVLEGRFQPAVWGRLDVGAPVTVHVYGMFDTRTVDARRGDPFSGELAERDGYARVLRGRGATGAKGPFVAFLNAVRATLAATGTLPMNLCFLTEGEEIMGSPTYAAHVERLRPKMEDVVASFNPSSAQAGRGAVAVGLGLKGMVVLELTASGEGWPHAPKRTIHSSAAGLVDSPPFRLAQALATLTHPDGSGCRVPELAALWDHRQALTAGRAEALRRLAERHAGRDPRDALPLGGAANVDALRGSDPLRDLLYGPTFNVAGLRAGFLGPNSGTIPFVVPGSATATIDVRTVVDLPAAEIVAAVRRHLDRHGFPDVAIETFAAYDHHQTDPEHPLVAAAEATLRAHGYEPVVWPIQPGGGPWTAVPNALGVPCLRGAVPGGGPGGDDEYLVIDGDERTAGLATTQKVHVDLMFAAAAALTPA
jgi:acetylornithine deacetylase/succinyl-diaminopimelate desuccinylase-like protein